MELDTSGHVPRINQLDSEYLDTEIVKIFNNHLQQAFKYFLRNPLDMLGPELEAFMKIIIWNFSTRASNSSIGQQLLGMKLHMENRFGILGAGFLNIISSYIQSRQSTITRMFPLHEAKLETSMKYLQMVLRVAELVNFVVFLQQGKYPSLVNRIFGLTPRSVVQERSSVGFSYLSRELLWHSLTELLIFILPLVDFSRMFTKFRTGVVAADKCSVCNEAPVCWVQSPCGHNYCHYCLLSRQGDGETFVCIICSQTFYKSALKYDRS